MGEFSFAPILLRGRWSQPSHSQLDDDYIDSPYKLIEKQWVQQWVQSRCPMIAEKALVEFQARRRTRP